MENEYIVTPNGNFVSGDELCHAGIKGMKWGIRRYQNKDGSLTPAGRKRYTNSDGSLNERGKKYYAKEQERLKAERKTISNQKRTESKFDKLDQMRKENERLKSGKLDSDVIDLDNKVPKKKPASDMDDKELQDKVNRLRNEDAYRDLSKKLGYDDGPKTEIDAKIAEMEKQKRYLELQRDINTLAPKKVPLGKKIMNTVMNDVVTPAATKAGKELLTKYLSETGANAVTKILGEQTAKVKADVERANRKAQAKLDEEAKKQSEKEAKKEAKKAAREASKAEERKYTDETSAKAVDLVINKFNDKKPAKSDYPDSDYEKRVDAMLAEIDARGWEIYNREYRQG